MKSLLIQLCFVLIICNLSLAQTAIKPSGTGTDVDPYQIETLDNLYWVSINSDQWDKHFSQIADIDAAECSTWKSGGWIPIGNAEVDFTGVYNGLKHSVSNIYINNDTTYVTGFFGILEGATVTRLRLLDVVISGKNNTAGLVGSAGNSRISECGVSGTITGEISVGGIVGSCSATGILDCYSACSVSGSWVVGGIAGGIYNPSTIAGCISTGELSGGSKVGGIAGWVDLSSTARNYWDTESTGVAVGYGYVNGFAESTLGASTAEMKLESTFDKITFVDTIDNVISGIWVMDPAVNDGYPSFSLHEVVLPVIASYGTNSITTTSAKVRFTIKEQGRSKVKNYGFYLSSTNENPDENDQIVQMGGALPRLDVDYFLDGLTQNTTYYIKGFFENSDGISFLRTMNFTTLVLYDSVVPAYGNGSVADPYQIATAQNLTWLSLRKDVVDKHFIQVADIDASEIKEWFPITGMGKQSFSGSYDGQGHIISNLSIHNYPSNSDLSSVGFFGDTYGATIKNIGLVNLELGEVYRPYGSGALIGSAHNTNIQECYVTGEIDIESDHIGGLIGYSLSSTIHDCYSMCTVTGKGDVGGLIGYMGGGIVTNCYSTGFVQNSGIGAGLVGRVYNANIESCFWDTITSDKSIGYVSYTVGTTYNIVGKSTSEMNSMKTFTDSAWDFVGETVNGTDDIWNIDQSYNGGYPFLSWQKHGETASVETLELTDTTAMSIIATGELTNFGDNTPTEYGFCHNTIGNPGIQNSQLVKQTNVPVIGNYSVLVDNLAQCQTYYIRAYAVNEFGVAYGSEFSFQVMDTISPTLSWTEGDQKVFSDPVSNEATIPDFRIIAEISDNCDVSGLTLVQIPEPGTVITTGETVAVRLVLSDIAGNMTEQSFNTSAYLKQTIDFEEGWNLVSFYVLPSENQLLTLFHDTKVTEVKSMESFWKINQPSYLNSLTEIKLGTGYLIKCEADETLVILGMTSQSEIMYDSTYFNWQLINSTSSQPVPFDNMFDSSNSIYIKSADGYWSPTDPQSSISTFEPGKAYYLLLKQ